ncbi:ATP-dependent Clp protease ATP-binding subunit [Clostridium sp. CM028]|uniref:ATP-dependent Clp protease ATP-binding subunit n=1 Tax=Clostridium TaxID=1485 RepID=UPI0013EE49FB|nr:MULTISPECIES: ATP-dependent Clp protease ATP-binding subunit [Clostridium]MBU3091577.1 ATP-dependent Clp protease ATP-binding subunit [Clostridium sp. CF011]MBW9144158.1 ATP-dependent Clp protease ATP-binding subunit [Clostridium sp. CM027]MBW9147531.1 ATP-dependent Clp protease ATP-binding subunit [Clostridium sp. CM028]MBZ9609965.1 ATP-dependent Clp protease ATP-binding subunit [Clostridium estertheticum]UVE41199.1 ATP-dependent Clp protease ATP-binding subunit [Clostridium sp. CM027]
MKLCEICKKNIAMILTSRIENGKTETIGLCIECAKKRGIPVMDQLVQQAGLSSEDIENLNEQMGNMFKNMNLEDIDLEDLNAPNMDIENGDKKKTIGNIFNGLFSPVDENSDFIEDEGQISSKIKETAEDKSKKNWFKKKRKNLDTYGINLTNKANQNGVDKVVGRDKEIDRVVQILNRRSKNNPILIGEAGVGKTAIAEGLAVRIVEKQVPEKLFNAEVYLLDLTAVVAGTQFRGQFESRMKSIIEEAKENGNIILVIDEVHNIMGAGEVQGGAMNAANILKPALAKGEIQVIGVTTLEEYRKYIEKDAALARRFQPVLVEEPSIAETIEILKGIRGYYEEYHKVKISDEVIEEVVNLSERYITERFLPDKAIDVIDEAGSRANLKNKGLVELAELKEESEKIQNGKKEAEVAGNFEKAAEYRMKLCKVKEDINETQEKYSDVQITLEDIAFVIESWTRIPIKKITEKEAKKLLNLEGRLHKRVIGQNEAIISLSRAIRRNRSGFRKKKKPSSFIFVGPTGVGKTELVKALSCELFGSEESLIRIDMSEYMEKHTVSKLIGAPPGYIGYDQGGQLTEKVRRKPYSVILLDEIEKAHPDVFNMLLQILEDGILTDSQGRTVSFENTVIIMTSNAGTKFNSGNIGFVQGDYDILESRVKDALKETFRPEFLNRVDEIIVFTTLKKEELRKIVDLMMMEVIGEVKEKKITVHVSEDVKDFILEKGYDDKYGARPLRRTIQKYIEDEIAEHYLENKFSEGSNISIELKDDKIVII